MLKACSEIRHNLNPLYQDMSVEKLHSKVLHITFFLKSLKKTIIHHNKLELSYYCARFSPILNTFKQPLGIHFTLVCPLISRVVSSNSALCPIQPMRPLRAAATTSQPVLTIQQVETIFYKIQEIFQIHKEFYDALLPSIQQWDEKVTVGHLFQKLVSGTLALHLYCVQIFFFSILPLLFPFHRLQRTCK